MSWFRNWFTDHFSSTWFNESGVEETVVDVDLLEYLIEQYALEVETESTQVTGAGGKPLTNEELATLIINNIRNSIKNEEVLLDVCAFKINQKRLKVDTNTNVEVIDLKQIDLTEKELYVEIDCDNDVNPQDFEYCINDAKIKISGSANLKCEDVSIDSSNDIRINISSKPKLKNNKLEIEQFKSNIEIENFAGTEQEIEELMLACLILQK